MTAEGKKHATIASHGTQSWQESRENTLDETARTDQVSDAEGLIVEADEPNHTYGRHRTGSTTGNTGENSEDSTGRCMHSCI